MIDANYNDSNGINDNDNAPLIAIFPSEICFQWMRLSTRLKKHSISTLPRIDVYFA